MIRRHAWLTVPAVCVLAFSALAQQKQQDFDPASADPVTQRPLYYLRELKKDELKDRSLRELALMRNWIFARAGNTFRKDWLANFFAGYGWYKPRAKQDLSSLTEYDKKNAALIATVEAGLTEDELRRRREPLLESLRNDPGYPDQPAHPSDVVELGLIATRLGEWVEPKPGAETVSPLENPKRLDKVLTLNDLRNLSRRDLRILRNMIYARHGRPFKSQILRDYFGSMDWYQEDAKYTDARLTKVDKKNIKLVQSLEKELGGPLTEQEHVMEEYGTGFLGAA